MIVIGVTGSISSGKTTASKIISFNKGPLFNADQIVNKLYRTSSFKEIVCKKFQIQSRSKFKLELKRKIIEKKENLKKLSKIIHPLVRKKMLDFLKNNKNKKYLFLEIPLLIENRLMKYFDKIIFIKSAKRIRIKRYRLNGGNMNLFSLLNGQQLKDSKKMNFCDYIVVNNKSLSILKKNLLNIMATYE